MNAHQKSNISLNLAALFIGIVITITVVIVIDKTFGWSMDIKVSKSHFFPRSHDIDGLGWTAKNDGQLKKHLAIAITPPGSIPLRALPAQTGKLDNSAPAY